VYSAAEKPRCGPPAKAVRVVFMPSEYRPAGRGEWAQPHFNVRNSNLRTETGVDPSALGKWSAGPAGGKSARLTCRPVFELFGKLSGFVAAAGDTHLFKVVCQVA
jgi:hypothetical protein